MTNKQNHFTMHKSFIDVLLILAIIAISFVIYLLLTLNINNDYIDNSTAVFIIFLPAIYYIYKKDSAKFKLNITNNISKKYTIIGVLIFTTLCVINSIWISSNYSVENLAYLKSYTMLGLIIYLLVICFIAPIIEEILFRFYVYDTVKKDYGIVVAFIISNALFVGFHALDSGYLGNIALQGIIYTFIYEKSKSIKSSIVVHIFNNSIWFLIIFLRPK